MPETLDSLAARIREWQERTFPTATPASAAAHLLSEAKELAANPASAEEIADCFHLVVACANLSCVDLPLAVSRKFAVNQAREWGEPNAAGFQEHIGAANRDAKLDESFADFRDKARALAEIGRVLDFAEAGEPISDSDDPTAKRVERLVACIAALEAESRDGEALARECARIAWFAGQSYSVRLTARGQSGSQVAAESIANAIAWDTQDVHEVSDAVLAAARARLQARAAKPPEPPPSKPAHDADDGAFKSAEEDAELVAMGRHLAGGYSHGDHGWNIGSISDLYGVCIDNGIDGWGATWHSPAMQVLLSEVARKTLRRVRAARAKGNADA